MKPKSLRRVAVVGAAAGWVAGWAVAGLETGAVEGAAGVGCAEPGWGSAGWELPPHAARVTAVRMASDATARRWVRLAMVVSFRTLADLPQHARRDLAAAQQRLGVRQRYAAKSTPSGGEEDPSNRPRHRSS